MNTDEILSQILFEKGFYKKIGVKPVRVEVWKTRFNQSKMSLEKKHEILKMAGYIVKSDIIQE